MNKLFILGSCVSRDAFALKEGANYNITSYLARTSFASAFHHNVVQGLDLSTIPSAFQRRMVENDVLKKTEHSLTHNQFDWLIIDLIDERFNLFASEQNEIFTLSPELSNNCHYDKSGKVIPSNSNEFFERWKEGWDKFIALAKQHNFLHKIILNKVFWTNKTVSDGNVVADTYQSWIDENNAWLGKLYTYIEQSSGIKVLEYPVELLKADDEHKWGLQPYHYDKKVYLHLLNYINHLNIYQKNLEQNIIHIDYLPLFMDALPIKKKNDSSYQPLILQGKKDADSTVSINIMLAGNHQVGPRDLLHTVKYEPENSEFYTQQKYAKSDWAEIGYFKYITTQPYQVYEREIIFKIPAGIKVFFSIQEFYPKGKSVILETNIHKVS